MEAKLLSRGLDNYVRRTRFAHDGYSRFIALQDRAGGRYSNSLVESQVLLIPVHDFI